MRRESGTPQVAGRPLVGRDKELQALRAGLDATASGRGRCVVLRGPFGLGKRRLSAAVGAEAAARGMGVLGARTTKLNRSSPLGPLFAALGEGPAPVLDVREAGRLARLAEHPGGWVELIGRLGELLGRRAGTSGLLLRLEDTQWADRLTLAAVADLSSRLAGAPVMWLLTHTDVPDERSARETFDQFVARTAEELQLAPLDPEASHHCLRDLLGGEPGPEADWLVRLAAGNPFLLGELVRLLRSEGRIRRRDGVTRVLGQDLPKGFGEAIAPVWHGLSQQAYDILRTGSLLGREFSLGHVAELLGSSPMGLASATQEAVDAGLLLDTGALFRFRSPLVRHAVYGALLGPVCQALHAQVAQCHAEQGRRGPEALAHLVLGTDRDNLRPSVELLRRTLDARPTPAEAADGARALIARLRDYEPVDAAPVVAAVRLLTAAGHPLHASAVAHRALLEAGWETPAETRALLELATLAVHLGDLGTVADRVDQALRDGGQERAARARLHALKALCGASGLPGDPAEAARRARAAVERGEHTRDRVAVALGNAALSAATRSAGELTSSLRAAQEAVDAAGAREDALGCLRHLWLASALCSHGKPLKADEVLPRPPHEPFGQGYTWPAPAWHLVRAQQAWARGRLEDVAREAEAGREAAARAGSTSLRWALTGVLALAATMRDQEETAAELLGGVPEEFPTPPGTLRSLAAFGRAVHLDAQGKPLAAVAHMRHVYDTPDQYLRFLTLDPMILPHLIRMALRAGAERRATAVHRTARRLAKLNPQVPTVAGAALHAEGLFRGDRGRLGRAVTTLRLSRHPLAVASALEDAGTAAFQLGKHQTAFGWWAEAQSIHVACGAALGEQRVQRRLRKCRTSGSEPTAGPARERPGGPAAPARPEERPAGRQPEPSGGWSSLTPSEERVVRLVAEGLTNRQTADRLSVSAHTVDSHLRRAFAKLGVSRRVELARHVLANSPATRLPDPMAK